MVYGQTEITHNLMQTHIDEAGGLVHYEAPAISVEGCDSECPRIIHEQNSQHQELICDSVAGCYYLYRALIAYYSEKRTDLLDRYSKTALR